MFVVKGLGAAILDAEMHVKRRPGSRSIDRFPTISWEDASEEMRDDPKVMWIKHGERKYTFRKVTEEEKAEIRLNGQWKLREEFKYILEHYGWKYAEEFYTRARRDEFEKYNVKINLYIPHCKYTKDGQCDLFCPFYECGNCYYREEGE